MPEVVGKDGIPIGYEDGAHLDCQVEIQAPGKIYGSFRTIR